MCAVFRHNRLKYPLYITDRGQRDVVTCWLYSVCIYLTLIAWTDLRYTLRKINRESRCYSTVNSED